MTAQPLRLLLVAAAATGLVACSTADEQETPAPHYPLTLEVQENPLLNPEAPSSPAPAPAAPAPTPAAVPAASPAGTTTRAPITTISSLAAFTLDYQYGEAPSHGSMAATKGIDGQWSSSGTWPTTAAENDADVSWYAHTAGTFQPGASPYITFTVDENAATQKDLLVAKTSGRYSATGGNLNFTFDHACTALRFLVKKATNLEDYTLTITNVQLCNVINSGQYYYDTAAWVLGTTRSSYTLYSGSARALGTTDYEALDASDAPYLFIIPQTLTPWDHETDLAAATTQTYVQITCAITEDGTDVFSGTAYIPFAATLTAGYQHDVRINIGKNSLYSASNTKIIQ